MPRVSDIHAQNFPVATVTTGFPRMSLRVRIALDTDDGTNFCPFCLSPAEVPRPGTIINATAARCAVAGAASGIVDKSKDAGHGGSPGYAAGSGVLLFSYDNITWPKNTGGWNLDFQPLVDAAIGRRPYFSNDSTAELIVRLGLAVPHKTAVSVSASALGKTVCKCSDVFPTADGRGTAIQFDLDQLPLSKHTINGAPTTRSGFSKRLLVSTAFNTTLAVSFSADSLGYSGSLVRRFVRVAPPPADVSAVVVDHRHRVSTQPLRISQQIKWPFFQKKITIVICNSPSSLHFQ